MANVIQCPACSKKLNVPDKLVGAAVRCPSCQNAFTATAAMDEVAPTVPGLEGSYPVHADEQPAEHRRYRKPVSDEYDDEDDEFHHGRRGHHRADREAAQTVAGPGIALMVAGGLGMVMALLILVLMLIGSKDPAPPLFGLPAADPDPVADTIVAIVFFSIMMCCSGVAFAGGFSLMQLRSYGLAMTGAIIALVPCSACWLLGLPFGIWALVTLNKPDVKRAFR
jgi:hypothetical protein